MRHIRPDTPTSTFAYREFRELQACVSKTSSTYWQELVQAPYLPSSITQVMYLERVQRVQRVVAV